MIKNTPTTTCKMRRSGKRGNGKGSITQLSNGLWQARITIEVGRRKAYYGKTRQEVAAKLAAALRDHDRGLPIVGEKQTLQQYLTDWLEVIRPRLRPRSFTRYEEAVRLHVIPTLGAHASREIERSAIAAAL